MFKMGIFQWGFSKWVSEFINRMRFLHVAHKLKCFWLVRAKGHVQNGEFFKMGE